MIGGCTATGGDGGEECNRNQNFSLFSSIKFGGKLGNFVSGMNGEEKGKCDISFHFLNTQN